MFKNIINERTSRTVSYTQAKIINVPEVSDYLRKSRLLKKNNQQIDRKAPKNSLSVSVQNSKIAMSVRSSTSIETENTNKTRNSKFVTIELNIKKRKPNNFSHNMSSNNMDFKTITNSFNSANCNCRLENDRDVEFRKLKEFLNSNNYVISTKKYIFLAAMILMSIFGLTISMIFLNKAINNS